MKYNPITRRMFLQGLGGFTFALPTLYSLLPENAMAQSQSNLRFVALISKNGQMRIPYFPTVTPGIKHAEHVHYMKMADIPGQISQVFGPDFDSIRGKISILHGLDIPGGDQDHNRCAPLTASAGTGSPVFPHSIDGILENSPAMYPTSPKLRALRVSPLAGQSWSWRNGQNLPALTDASAAFNTAFSGFTGGGGGGGGTGPTPDQQRRTRLIDLVLGDYNKLIGSRKLSSEDNQKLQNYVDLVTDLQKSLEVTPTTPPATCTSPSLRSGFADSVYVDAHYKNHLDVIAAALICGITKVSVVNIMHWRSEKSYDGNEFHNNSHYNENNGAGSSTTASGSWNRWIGNQVAYLMKKLDAFTDPNGKTVLDNSVVYWGNELGPGRGHFLGNMPVFIGGGAGGKLRTGHYIDFRKRPYVQYPQNFFQIGRPYNGLMMSMLNAFGVAPSEYELSGKPGFGQWGLKFPYQTEAYTSFTNPRETLPFYYIG